MNSYNKDTIKFDINLYVIRNLLCRLSVFVAFIISKHL